MAGIHANDRDAMAKELLSKSGRTKISQALTKFTAGSATHSAALALLPPDWSTGLGYYCSSPKCVFNTHRPGSRARRSTGGGLLCTWCDPVLLSTTMATPNGLKTIRNALTMFEASDEAVLNKALLLLPDGFTRAGVRWECCRYVGCAFNAIRPGTPAWAATESSHCVWHDRDAMARALAKPQGRRAVRWILSCLKNQDPGDVDASLWSQALGCLPKDFALSAKMCANAQCCFSLHAPGKPARSHRKSDLCAWCDRALLAERQESVQGHRLIAVSMATWRRHSDVLRAAWGKLSPSFRSASARRATQMFERKVMAKHDLVCGASRNLSLPLSSNSRKLGGCECDLCGQTFLWRQMVESWELKTGQIEDAINYDQL